jgi:cellulose synthase/poly-beta-1,6-N-acetylglucosamine synthase-like glycosyltransferase
MNLLLIRSLGHEPELEPAGQACDPETVPLVSVIIPAKDEEDHIESALRSVQDSEYPNIEIIIVNDRSSDRTPEIIEGIAREDPRVRYLSVTHLPAGWTGKTHALFAGARLASGDLFLFSDADTDLDPTAICHAVNHLIRNKLHMLSLYPQFKERRFSENAVYPHLALGLSSVYPPRVVNDPGKPGALASGCFILITKEAYERVGTWENFRAEITEDIALSKSVKAKGLNLHVTRARHLVRTVPFSGLSEVCRFWKRTFYGGLERRIALIFRLFTNYVALTFLFAVNIFAALLLFTGSQTWPLVALTALSTAASVMVMIPYGFVVRDEGGSCWYGLSAPIGIAISVWVAATALFAVISRRGIDWRGSTYT